MTVSKNELKVFAILLFSVKNSPFSLNSIFDSPKECLFEKYGLQLFQNGFESFSGFNLSKITTKKGNLKSSSDTHHVNNVFHKANLKEKQISVQENKFEKDCQKEDYVQGITWDSNTEMLNFNVSNKIVPKRQKGILSAISWNLDPMCLVAPVIVKIKLLIQELWRRGFEWDTKIPDDLLKQWNIWKQNVVKLSSLNIPHWINFSSNSEVVKLNIFADVSSVAYGTAAYIKVVYQNSASCSLIIGKCKLAPMKR